MKSLVIILITLLFTNFAHAEMTIWKKNELTQEYISSLTKDQCVEKTISSLKTGNQSEKYLKNLAGISGDCVDWAKGTEEQFCRTYAEKHIGEVCSANVLKARQCILIHTMYLSSCYTKKYK